MATFEHRRWVETSVLVCAALAACGRRAPEHATGPIGADRDETTYEDGGSLWFPALPRDSGTPHMAPMPDANAPAEPCVIDTPRILILYGGAIGEDHAYAGEARAILDRHRIAYEARPAGEDELQYEIDGVGNYGAILFTDYDAYDDLSASNRERLDDYARRCGAGMYFLYVPGNAELSAGEITTSARSTLSDARVDSTSPVLDLTRDGGTLEGDLPGRGLVFRFSEANYSAVAWASREGAQGPFVLADDGAHDGVRRVFNGRDFDAHFLGELLLLDALSWLSPVDLGLLRQRYIGVDIDDVFMPNYDDEENKRTVKIQADDVPALLATQAHISSTMGRDFRFTIGFNVAYYGVQFGDAALYDDPAGDAALVANRSAFYWFDHLKHHTIVKDQAVDELAGYMRDARAWAEETGVIDYVGRYAVTPQHSGISQRYAPLYEAWRDVWDIGYSSDTSGTVNGFEYMGIHVAPRSQAGIWSGQYSFAEVSPSSLERMARGGAVYREVIARPVSIFMTHQSNYARDRLGNKLFEELFDFLARWTHYEIHSGTPDALVARHFELAATPDK